ncbi:hypothetical protein D9758_006908 [Tetrapyrgos nigripes]|uniref:Uncharacterized protein n=1 Tax=Tetrapyrgos nigripes TaxID=182062 RepID=A0A8H5GSU1_9AGAR|nr:hypothetical protein D9758_006908 [Tetrapyrgos nigripes]
MPTVLVANRGEIAIRVLRAAKELEWSTVAVFTEKDTSHTAFADEAVKLDNVSQYMDAKSMVEVARRTHSTHIHPGYGFLSESTELALACQEAGITFIGPTVDTLRVASDKMKSRQLAISLGVKVAPGDRIRSPEDVIQLGESVGYPIMIKALDGGGGRGIRIVEGSGEVEDAFKRCLGESPSKQLFAEKALTGPGWKHIEVQIIGDGKDVVHLWERECSVQRRFQKIMEIAPSSLSRESISPLIDSALRMARSLRYKSLGTFEFLFNTRTSDLIFLEINPRLQVEHTVTGEILHTPNGYYSRKLTTPFLEEIMSIDILRAQLLLSLPETSLHSLSLSTVAIHRGCAIQLRLTAEDSSRSFTLSPGRILAKDLSWPSGPGIRVDTWLTHSAEWIVGTDFDSVLGKLIIHGLTFDEATQKAKRALRELRVGAVVKTNVDVLLGVLNHDDWRAGRIDTLWLERNLNDVLRLGSPGQKDSSPSQSLSPADMESAATSGGLGSQSTVSLRPGTVFNLTFSPQTSASSATHSLPAETKHTLTLSSVALNTFPDRLSGTIQGTILPVPFSFDLIQSTSVSLSSSEYEFGDQNNPSHVVSPITGKIVDLHPAFADVQSKTTGKAGGDDGQKIGLGRVKKGETLAVLSVMKMESIITTPRDGVIERFGNGVRIGVIIGEGMLVAVVSGELKSRL